ncbi:hypothetical protein Ddye_022544 [Dipteronia dyeriana]|uniref:Uncharacterized protein n=1 Tax=Dipteronia dyeriana TaxID=168575 RepID=A0AAD9TRF1_9ROSI|nr:hypothetical protein Ddye_022544 [Dipteronia dyeriana]
MDLSNNLLRLNKFSTGTLAMLEFRIEFYTPSTKKLIKPSDHSQFFKSTGDLFRKYPPLSPPRQSDKPSSSRTTQPIKKSSPRKKKASDHHKHTIYVSHQSTSFSEETSTETSNAPSKSSYESYSSWEIYSPASFEQSYHSGNLSDSDALLDLSQIFMASRTDPQSSTHTVETTSDETLDEPTPIVDEPLEHKPQAPAHVPRTTNGHWFNLEDSAPHHWRRIMLEMSTLLDLQTSKRENNTKTILREFVSRFTGSLIDLYQTYVFSIPCLGGINDESLRQVYLNSLPTELQSELQQTIELSNRTLRDITLGEIHMFTLTALDKLCATQRVFTKMIKEGRKYDKNCKLPDSYHLKCKSTDHCNCRPYRCSRRQPRKEMVFPSNKKNRKYKYHQKKARRS